MQRRKFISRSIWGLAALGITGGLYAWQVEPFWLEFVKHKMPIENLPEHLVGKTLMQISDIHIGPRFNHNYIIESFKNAQQYNPDFVVYTGDYVTLAKDVVYYDTLQEVLRNKVQGQLGTIGILGNHDYGRNWAQHEVADRISEMLQTNGITLLRNQQREIEGLNIMALMISGD